MNGKELIKLLEKNGYTVVRISGSHHTMKKEGFPSIVVPVHGGQDLGKGLELDILKKAGLRGQK